MCHVISSATTLLRLMGARREGGKSSRSPSLENQEKKCSVLFPPCEHFFPTFLLRFSPYGGGGGLFHHVGAFLLLFFFMWRAFFGLAPPPTKISAGAHATADGCSICRSKTFCQFSQNNTSGSGGLVGQFTVII